MARDFARIGTDMPDEPSIVSLTVGAQWLYDRLLMSRDLSRCGVLANRPALWADRAADATPTKVAKWLKELTISRHVIVDERYAEVLVRTHVKHDGILGQPNVVAAMVSAYRVVASPTIRNAFLIEMRRLWDLDSLAIGERGGWLLAMGHYPAPKTSDGTTWPAVLPADNLARIRKAIGPGLREDMTAACTEGSVRPFDEASPQGIPEPFGGPPRAIAIAESPVPRSPTTSPGHRVPAPAGPRRGTGPAAAAAHAHPAAAALVAETGPTVPAVHERLVAQVAELLDAGTDIDAVRRGLVDWRSRVRPGPGLLPHLVQDQLDAGQTIDPRFAGLAEDARRHA